MSSYGEIIILWRVVGRGGLAEPQCLKLFDVGII